jgi:dTDP-glucose 4,6-dehydratase
MEILVTGGRGFIGSHFVERVLEDGHTVVDIDCMSYCSNDSLPFDSNPNYKHMNIDICDLKHLPSCDVIVNFAAETHVDNSINDTNPFIHSNIIGVHNLLEIVRGKQLHERPLFVQISTDEVYGDRMDGSFKEEDRLTPSNPYAASKAAAEMLVLSYHRTYGINYLITRSSNNYGPRQYHEKLIPKSLRCLEIGKKIPIHGDGSYVRDWIYVKDNADAICTLIVSGYANDVFNIGANNHMTNLQVVDTLLDSFGKTREEIQFVPNRWGQDLRYSLDTSKIRSIGWEPSKNTMKGIYKWWN